MKGTDRARMLGAVVGKHLSSPRRHRPNSGARDAAIEHPLRGARDPQGFMGPEALLGCKDFY